MERISDHLSEEAAPGPAPGSSGVLGTLFAALYGELTPHPWRDPENDRDVYIRFHDRSRAMGWLDDRAVSIRQTPEGVVERKVGSPGLWGMNDAGQENPASPETPLVAWFQVGLAGPVAADQSLPVQPFLRCIGDVLGRMGTLDLRAVQILLPVGDLDLTSARDWPPSLTDADWFDDSDPRQRTTVRVTMDSGRDPVIPSAARRLRESMNRFEQQKVFMCESHSLTDHDPLTMTPPFDAVFWNGPPQHRVSFTGTLAEWSLDAIGWLAAFLADLSAREGADTTVLFTAVRSRR